MGYRNYQLTTGLFRFVRQTLQLHHPRAEAFKQIDNFIQIDRHIVLDMHDGQWGEPTLAHGRSHVPSHCVDWTLALARCHEKSSRNLEKNVQVREIIRITCFQGGSAWISRNYPSLHLHLPTLKFGKEERVAKADHLCIDLLSQFVLKLLTIVICAYRTFCDTVSVFLKGNLNWIKTLRVCFPFLHYLLKAKNWQLVFLVLHYWPAKGWTPRTLPPSYAPGKVIVGRFLSWMGSNFWGMDLKEGVSFRLSHPYK